MNPTDIRRGIEMSVKDVVAELNSMASKVRYASMPSRVVIVIVLRRGWAGLGSDAVRAWAWDERSCWGVPSPVESRSCLSSRDGGHLCFSSACTMCDVAH